MSPYTNCMRGSQGAKADSPPRTSRTWVCSELEKTLEGALWVCSAIFLGIPAGVRGRSAKDEGFEATGGTLRDNPWFGRLNSHNGETVALEGSVSPLCPVLEGSG